MLVTAGGMRFASQSAVNNEQKTSLLEEKLEDARALRQKWMSRGIWLVAFILLCWFMKWAAVVFVPIAGSLLLALIFKPLVRRLHGYGIPPAFSALIIMAIVVSLFAALLFRSGQTVVMWIEDLPDTTRQVQERISSFRGSMDHLSEASKEIGKLTDGGDANLIPEVKIQEESMLPSIVGQAMPMLGGLLMVVFLTYFLMVSSDDFLRAAVESVPRLREKKYIVEAVRRLEHDVSHYLVLRTIINVGLGITVWGALYLMEMPNPLTWGILAAVFNYIPYVGAFAIGSAASLIALITFDSPMDAVLIGIIFVVLNTLEGFVVCPLVFGRHLRLNPVVVMVGLTFWAWIWGLAGAIMAVPLMVCLRIACEYIDGLEWFGRLLAGGKMPREERVTAVRTEQADHGDATNPGTTQGSPNTAA